MPVITYFSARSEKAARLVQEGFDSRCTRRCWHRDSAFIGLSLGTSLSRVAASAVVGDIGVFFEV